MSRENTNALEPCPFCGGTELLQTDKMEQDYGDVAAEAMGRDGPGADPEDEWFVVCGGCGALGPMSPSAEQAHAAWNRRA